LFKLIMTMKKREGMSRQDFMTYYDERHLAYGATVVPPLEAGANGATLHRRNFVVLDDPLLAFVGEGRAVTENPDFDVITEMLFDSRDDAIAMMRVLFRPEVIDKIRDDERQFVELDTIKFYVVEVHETALT
jgi:hypothetical protein